VEIFTESFFVEEGCHQAYLSKGRFLMDDALS
jgi:hypothetical protein